jgi:hypothetical protein
VAIAKHFVVEITAKARRVLKPNFDYAPIPTGGTSRIAAVGRNPRVSGPPWCAFVSLAGAEVVLAVVCWILYVVYWL